MAGLTALLAASQGLQAGTGLASSILQAGSIRAQGRYESAALNVNARMAEMQAQDALIRGDQEAGAARRQGKAVMGAQRAALAAQGLTGADASGLLGETNLISGLNADQARANAALEAWSFQQQAGEYRRQGALVQKAAKTNSRATLLTGGLAFAQGLGQVGQTLGKLSQEKRQQAMYQQGSAAASSAFNWARGRY